MPAIHTSGVSAGYTLIGSRARVDAGIVLARLREAYHVRIEQVAAELNLTVGQIRGLEQGEINSFFDSADYMRGLGRYAAYLGADASQIVRTAEPSARRARRSKAPRLLALSATVLAVAGVAALAGLLMLPHASMFSSAPPQHESSENVPPLMSSSESTLGEPTRIPTILFAPDEGGAPTPRRKGPLILRFNAGQPKASRPTSRAATPETLGER